MNLAQFNKKAGYNKSQSVNGVQIKNYNKKTKNSFVMGNKHFFNGSHDSLSIINKKVFLAYYNNLTYKQREVLYVFFEALNNDTLLSVSEVKKTKKFELTYVTVKFIHNDVTYTKNMFYFFGLSKLLSFQGKAKYNLSLKALVKLAKEN